MRLSSSQRYSCGADTATDKGFNRRGAVLIIVLLMLALMISISIAMYDKTIESYVKIVKVHDYNQGNVHMTTAIEAFKALMTYDEVDYDGQDDLWVVIPPIELNNGTLVMSVRPLDGRLPINAFTNKDEKIQKRVQDAFNELLAYELGFDEDVWRSMRDWVVPSSEVMMSITVSGTEFNQEGNSYTAKHAPLSTLPEIRLIPGMPEIYEEIEGYLTIGEQTPKININFADKLVISALIPEFAPHVDEIIEKREEEPFKNKDELYTLMGSASRESYIAALPFFDVKSSLFYMRIELHLPESVHNYHVLLKRDGKNISVVRYVEGGSLNYF